MPAWASVSDEVSFPVMHVARLEVLPINNI